MKKNIQINRIIKESINKVLNEKWEDDYNAAMDKSDYEENKALYDSKTWYKKIAAMMSGNKPKDPNPSKTLKELLDRYVDAFNYEHNIGPRTNYSNGESFSSAIKYQKDNKQPVLSASYNDGENIYMSRKAFDNKGNKQELGIPYPYSETGFTMNGEPNNYYYKNNPDAQRKYQQFQKHQDEISNVIKNRNNRKGGN